MITRLTFGGVGVGSVCCVAEVQAAEAKDNAALKGSSTPWLIGGAAFILTTAAGYFLLREQDDKKKKPFVIGVTGGIATGKSTVIRHLSSMGATVLDADKLGHNAYEKGTTCFDQETHNVEMMSDIDDRCLEPMSDPDVTFSRSLLRLDRRSLEKMVR